jgi:hypothetical protein
MPAVKKRQQKKSRAIKIERGIPLPKYTKMPSKDTFLENLKMLKPEESFLVDKDFSDAALNALRTRVHTAKTENKLEGRFTSNLDPVTGKKMRVWRVE